LFVICFCNIFFLQLTHCNLTLDSVLRFYISEIRRFLRIHVTVCPPLQNFCYYCFGFFLVFRCVFFQTFYSLREACLLGFCLKEKNWNIVEFCLVSVSKLFGFLISFWYPIVTFCKKYMKAVPNNVHPIFLGLCFYLFWYIR